MRRIALVFIIFCGILFFSACEKDDICVDAATPQLVIRFYNQIDTTKLKEVSGLKVQGLLGRIEFPVITNISSSEIKVPLRADTTSSSFIITRNTTLEDTTTANIDTVIFTYELNKQYKSRACGFVMNFENILGTISTQDNWMTQIEILTPSLIVNDTTANVKIFH